MKQLVGLIPSTVAMICLTVVELAAIRAKLDGVALSGYTLAVAGLGGYHLHAYLTRKH